MKKEIEDLPDYTVAEMDLEGMPWNSRRLWQIFPGPPAQGKRSHRMNRQAADGLDQTGNMDEEIPVSRKERRIMIGAALKAAFLIWGVFAAVIFVFLLFCVFVWFR